MAQPRSSDPIPSGPWDVVVIGAGAAGLMTCLDLPPEFKVLLLNRNTCLLYTSDAADDP